MKPLSPPVWVGFANEQAELIIEYLRREPAPDPEFVIRHAMSLAQAAELGRQDRIRPPLIGGKAAAW